VSFDRWLFVDMPVMIKPIPIDAVAKAASIHKFIKAK
jgi:hypothetical protein